MGYTHFSADVLWDFAGEDIRGAGHCRHVSTSSSWSVLALWITEHDVLSHQSHRKELPLMNFDTSEPKQKQGSLRGQDAYSAVVFAKGGKL